MATATEVNPQVIDDLTITNVKTVAGIPAQLANMMLANMVANQQISNQNATAHQQAMQSLQEFTLAETFGQRAGVDTSEAAAVAKVQSSDQAVRLAELGAGVTSILQMVKGGALTPPTTGVPA